MKTYKLNKSFTYDNKRYYVHANSKTEAEVKKAMKIRDLQEGRKATNGSSTVKEWVEVCLSTYKTNLGESSYCRYKNRINKWVVEPIGFMKLKSVKPLHCQKIMNDLEGYSKFQINTVNQMLNFIFNRALENNLIIANPARNLTKPKGIVTKRRPLTPQETKSFLMVSKKKEDYIYFLLMYYCGLRPSEAREAKGSDIKKLGEEYVLNIRGTKNANATRTIPIPDELYNRIKRSNKFYYMANNSSKKITAYQDRALWKKLKSELYYNNSIKNLDSILSDSTLTPYCLRHTFCTNLQKQGVDIRTAQYLMGHSSIELTANIYTHADEETILSAAKIINCR